MHRRLIGATLFVGLVVGVMASLATPRDVLAAQQPFAISGTADGESLVMAPATAVLPAPIQASSMPSLSPKLMLAGSPKSAPAFEHDPDLDAQDQISPSQVPQQMPDAVAMPSGGSQTHPSTHGGNAAAVEPAAIARPAMSKQNIVACGGVFARDSSHAKLAAAFQPRNVAVTQLDANSGAKVTASVLYAKDPKRRLEVWWAKPASRSDTHLIVINGQSDWIAPGELHLGLTLAELEKLNGKPFKLSGFDGDHVATLSDWDGGTLSALTGGCKVGISLHADPKAATATLSGLPANRSFSSSDASLRAANPTVSEILVAY
jgi:hypothetical protein